MKLSLEPTEEFKEYVEKEKHGEVLKNLLHIKGKKLLEDAEADYVTYRLKEIAINLLPGTYDYEHLLDMHKYIFQDIYEWAGQPRKLNIYKSSFSVTELLLKMARGKYCFKSGKIMDFGRSLVILWRLAIIPNSSLYEHY